MPSKALDVEFEDVGFSCYATPQMPAAWRGIRTLWTLVAWVPLLAYWGNRLFLLRDHPFPQGTDRFLMTWFASLIVAALTIAALDGFGRLVIGGVKWFRDGVRLLIDVDSERISIGRYLAWVIPMPARKVALTDLRDVTIDPREGDLVLATTHGDVRIPMAGNSSEDLVWLQEQLLARRQG